VPWSWASWDETASRDESQSSGHRCARRWNAISTCGRQREKGGDRASCAGCGSSRGDAWRRKTREKAARLGSRARPGWRPLPRWRCPCSSCSGTGVQRGCRGLAERVGRRSRRSAEARRWEKTSWRSGQIESFWAPGEGPSCRPGACATADPSCTGSCPVSSWGCYVFSSDG